MVDEGNFVVIAKLAAVLFRPVVKQVSTTYEQPLCRVHQKKNKANSVIDY